MENKPFLDKSLEPAENNLKKILLSAFTYYEELMKNSQALSQQ